MQPVYELPALYNSSCQLFDWTDDGDCSKTSMCNVQQCNETLGIPNILEGVKSIAKNKWKS